MSIFNIAGNDSQFFEAALQEYRATTGDCSKFIDLHRTAQHVILQRARRLKENDLQKSSGGVSLPPEDWREHHEA